VYKPYIPIYFSGNEAHVPAIEEMESALSEGVVALADPCFNFSSFPYEIEKGEMTVVSKLLESSADITINIPLTITDNNEVYTIEVLNINVPTNLLSLYAAAQLMTEQQHVDINRICVTCLARIAEENQLNINSEEFATEETYNVLYKLQDVTEKGPVFSFMYVFSFSEKTSSLNLLSIPNQEAIIGYTFTYTAFASGENVQYTDDSDLFDIDSDTGIISFVPTKEDIGTFIITITVKDKLNQTDKQSFVFTVKNIVSSDLSVEPLPYFIAEVGNSFEYKMNATSNYTVYFSDDTTLFDIDLKTGEINFTPIESDIGEHGFNITITDTIGNYHVEEGSITVVKV
jgi:ribosomal 50S subunit-recycling heat shock protein